MSRSSICRQVEQMAQRIYRTNPPGWSWTEGLVDETKEHFELQFGEPGTFGLNSNWVRVALVGKGIANSVIAQFLVRIDSPELAAMVDAIKNELDFFFVQLHEQDPWQYGIYHCSTASNLYSNVHWSYFTESQKSIKPSET